MRADFLRRRRAFGPRRQPGFAQAHITAPHGFVVHHSQTASNSFHFSGILRVIFTLLEALGIVACFKDVAMMGNAIQ